MQTHNLYLIYLRLNNNNKKPPPQKEQGLQKNLEPTRVTLPDRWTRAQCRPSSDARPSGGSAAPGQSPRSASA
jgi:hypothetical protein